MTRAPRLTRAERRASIVEATLPLLERYGQQLTTRQVAEAAGVAEGTIFRAFDSLEEVIDEAVAAALSPERLARLLEHTAFPGTLVGDTDAAFAAVARYHDAVRTMFHLSHGAAGHVTGASCAREELAGRYLEVLDFLTARFTPHADELAVTPREFAQLLLALASGERGHFIPSVAPLSRALLVATVLDGARRHP
ncbi:TetR/AcrR family transcriptional regulator [uncultured Tessaracoccus sp.]|uniref:TetR/AcrR family transcriptional regulator n=1 Tax=uncultured Tessaracoccus sp. TaxID=905023 RepID=UPI0025E90D5E|nr:TetR/AcrR family transcriptional regulator [uncultured Tessaracoccus sp.]